MEFGPGRSHGKQFTPMPKSDNHLLPRAMVPIFNESRSFPFDSVCRLREELPPHRCIARPGGVEVGPLDAGEVDHEAAGSVAAAFVGKPSKSEFGTQGTFRRTMGFSGAV